MTVQLCKCGSLAFEDTTYCTTAGCSSDRTASRREMKFKRALLQLVNRGEPLLEANIRCELGIYNYDTTLRSECVAWVDEIREATGK